jgi:hypothetical protein
MAAETDTAVSEPVPDSVDVEGAVALLGDAAIEDTGREPETDVEPAPAASDDRDDEQPEADSQTVETDGPPEFWSADDKAMWRDVPEGLRPVIAKYEQQRIAYVNEKSREAAQAREEAMHIAQNAAAAVDRAAAWWQQNGAAFHQAFTDKWSQVDWNKLAEENPAEWTRLKQQRDNEAALLLEANRRGQAEMAAANLRAEAAFHEARQAEHAKVVAEMPEHFGTPEKAARTYGELGDYLLSQGVSVDRINAIHEATIIKLAMKAYLYDQAKKQVSATTSRDAAGRITAQQTPTRVQPGPAARATGNRTAEAARQVGERFRRSGSVSDAAELIRLSGL